VPEAVYVDALELASIAKRPEVSAVYSYKRKLRSVVIGSQAYKLRFCTDAELGELRSAYSKLLGPDAASAWSPSSWSSLFNEISRVPRVPWTLRRAFPQSIIGGWEEARAVGVIKEPLYHYDMVSAYYWAGTAPLPVARTARVVHSYAGPGIYKVKLLGSRLRRLPPPLRETGVEVWVSQEEIEQLRLEVEIVYGFVFEDWWKPSALLSELREAAPTMYKRVLRAYWGGWAAESGPDVHYPKSGKRRTLPNPWRDTVAAHFITSRVRARMAVEAPDAEYYYVDSVLLPRRLPEGRDVGEWRLEGCYVAGRIMGAGRYIAYSDKGKRIEKRSGVPLTVTVAAG
jgi:hypothetical protein